jgi:hypothetical protein
MSCLWTAEKSPVSQQIPKVFNPKATITFDLNPPPLVEDPNGSTDPVTIHKENVECRTRNIE